LIERMIDPACTRPAIILRKPARGHDCDAVRTLIEEGKRAAFEAKMNGTNGAARVRDDVPAVGGEVMPKNGEE